MFYSILFATADDRENAIEQHQDTVLSDLNIDQIIAAIIGKRPEYDLRPLFTRTLTTAAAIRFRHAVMRDLEQPELRQGINGFSRELSELRHQLKFADRLECYNRAGCFLDIISNYLRIVGELAKLLDELPLSSDGFQRLRDHLAAYRGSEHISAMRYKLERLKKNLSEVEYSLNIKGNSIRVSKPAAGEPYLNLLHKLFDKFKDGEVKSYLVNLPGGIGLNQVENRVLELVAKLYPDIFKHLTNYYQLYRDTFLDKTIADFDYEVQFYLAYLDYIEPIKEHGLPFCYPEVCAPGENYYCQQGFDLALAAKLVREKLPIVCNDWELNAPERLFIISGPNQGGKTTFARMFGQLHFLAALGCKVPGKSARVLRINRLFTHFEREEKVKNLRGKLLDELTRMHRIMSQVTQDDIVIMNEIFTSTTVTDARLLSKKIITQLSKMHIITVCVTFIVELADLNVATVGMASEVIAGNPALRSYKITRQPLPEELFAHTLADKYRLSYEQLQSRVK